ncbi:MAG TPA: nucleoside monophosphate kinase [Candidatus Paceibacterota bacterium]|nr:nucleoside monophosphate kinase [Candidatus Paceibacterota bacterium]
MKKVFILIGATGSGKGTQAELIAKKYKLVHFETSKILEKRLARAKKSDKEIMIAKKQYYAGRLVIPALVARIVFDEIKEFHKKGKGIVFSGSPRTLLEARVEMPLLEKLYDRKNIHIFYIKLTEKESVRRNSVRKICVKNRHPIPFVLKEFKNVKKCPWDGSKIVTRALDKPSIIARRYKVFLKDTRPVLNYFKKHRFPAFPINGLQPIEKVHADIVKKI